MSKPFMGVSVSSPHTPTIKRRYSVTSDVVGFRRCARQYGAFRIHNYAPAYQTQLYFGTIIHQVLDRCHIHYHGGVNPSTKGSLPDDGLILNNSEIVDYFDEVRDAERVKSSMPTAPSDIISYFIEVENGLKSRGIRAITRDLRLQAVRILQYFNALEGPVLYPRVIDTEYRLQADRNTHILRGVVDLLVDTSSHTGDPADCEIWDYKGTSYLKLTADDLKTYKFQMLVYAWLYEQKHGVRPRQANLYFLNELDGKTPPKKRPINALLSVDLESYAIKEAVDQFTQTVTEIEQARKLDQWPPAKPGTISEVQDCAICDLRWDCSTPTVKLRYP